MTGQCVTLCDSVTQCTQCALWTTMDHYGSWALWGSGSRSKHAGARIVRVRANSNMSACPERPVVLGLGALSRASMSTCRTTGLEVAIAVSLARKSSQKSEALLCWAPGAGPTLPFPSALPLCLSRLSLKRQTARGSPFSAPEAAVPFFSPRGVAASQRLRIRHARFSFGPIPLTISAVPWCQHSKVVER